MAQTNKFWAAPDSSDEAERDSESEASVEQPQTFRAAGGKFGKATYEESDSGKCVASVQMVA